jgi:hypothetical protein
MRSKRLTYANVMSTLAVFIALGGSSYAAITISGSSIRNRSISGAKLRKNTLTGRQIRESTLGRVERARVADNATLLSGLRADDLRLRCPADMYPIADVCVERTTRAAAPYTSAIITCLNADGASGPGRRLPTHGEMLAALTAFDPPPEGELTGEVYPSTTTPGRLDVLYVTDKVASAALTSNNPAGEKPFRCVADPRNSP